MKYNTDDIHYKGAITHKTTKLTLLLSPKMDGTQRRALVRKSMKNTLNILRYATKHFLGQSDVYDLRIIDLRIIGDLSRYVHQQWQVCVSAKVEYQQR